MDFNIRILDEEWKAGLTGLSKLAPLVYGIEELYGVLNSNYSYHMDADLIKRLQMVIIRGKQLTANDINTEEIPKEFPDIFEEAWALFSDAVNVPIHDVDDESKSRVVAMDDYLQLLDIQCSGFTSRVPPVDEETMTALRDLKFKFQSPLASACNILMGREIFNTKLTQLRFHEFLALAEAARVDVEAFVNTIE